ncbi:MAG: hypothetical protein BWY83_03156 [bacterium ADurb.Bin478]|nr:MAG: hypothetical protein BWY83_03156 [bacterium ADurb.Bin478]
MKSFRPICSLVLLLTALSCEEKMPPRIQPQNTLALTNVFYTQGAYASGPFMEFLFIITNLYEETFEGKVQIVGKAHVWMKKTPSIRATIAIGNHHLAPPSKIVGDVLTIDPGGRCALKVYWYLLLDDGRNLLDLLDYSGNAATGGLIRSKPELFVMDAEIKLFNQLGYLQSERLVFEFTGYKPAEEKSE